MTTSWNCKHCGQPATDSMKFCGKCGGNLQPTAAPITPKPKSRLRHPIAAAIFVIWIVVFGGYGAYKGYTHPAAASTTKDSTDRVAKSDRGDADPVEPVVPWDSYVSKIREGVLSAPYNTTTVGKAFEGTFTDCKWRSDETAKGVHFVEFTGRLKPEKYKESFERLQSQYHQCVNPLRAWYATKMNEHQQHPGSADDSSGDTCNAMFDLTRDHVMIDCHDKTGKTLDMTNLDALPEEPGRSCGIPPDEVKYSSVKFQFLFAADEQSFKVGYFDEVPWVSVSSTGAALAALGARADMLAAFGAKADIDRVLKYIYESN